MKILALLALVLTSCAMRPPATAEEAMLKTGTLQDPVLGTFHAGPSVTLDSHTAWFLRTGAADVVLVALVTVGREPVEVQVDDSTGWSRFPKSKTVWVAADEQIQSATDHEGNPLTVTKLEQNYLATCVAVELTRQYLVDHPDGFTVRFYGEAGERVVEVSRAYVDGFLARVDEASH